jgi:hypothetical protein
MRGETVHPKIFKKLSVRLSLHHTPSFLSCEHTLNTHRTTTTTTTKGEKGKTLG